MKTVIEPWEKPLIIIAAARSGTKMLREVIAASPNVVDFPYDMNYIWKYRNYDIPHDELTSEHITPEIINFIRKNFEKRYKKTKSAIILEKSVSNSLRVKFVKEIFPKAKIIHLFRDGRDVAADARLCWKDSAFSERIQSKRDLFFKLKEFPYSTAWPYLVNYVTLYFKRAYSGKNHVKSWGPRFEGIDEAIKMNSLLEVCAMQWTRSVEVSLSHLSHFKENEDYINLRYEDFVADPIFHLQRIADFAQIQEVQPVKQFSLAKVTSDYVGFWQKTLSKEELKKIMPIISQQMNALGYIMD